MELHMEFLRFYIKTKLNEMVFIKCEMGDMGFTCFVKDDALYLDYHGGIFHD